MDKKNTATQIHTDGSCWPNPGTGGWAFAFDKETHFGGSEENTTNNRMELMAIINAITYCIKKGMVQDLVIISDSMYCVKGFNTWMHSWKKKDWKRGQNDMKNHQLWKDLYKYGHLYKGNIKLSWVRGHNGNEMNEFVDKLAEMERLKLSQKLDNDK